MAQQKQVHELQSQFTEVAQANQLLYKECANIQKILATQRQAHLEMVHYLETNNPRKRSHPSSQSPVISVEPPSELRRIRDLLGTGTADDSERQSLIYPSPADSGVSSAMYGAPDMGASSLNSGMGIMGDQVDMGKFAVYPVGQTVGIEPFHPDHIPNIPYGASNGVSGSVMDGMSEGGSSTVVPPPPSTTTEDSAKWGAVKQPSVLLVEDDKISRRTGEKFLRGLGCSVDTAVCPAHPSPRTHFRTNALRRAMDSRL